MDTAHRKTTYSGFSFRSMAIAGLTLASVTACTNSESKGKEPGKEPVKDSRPNIIFAFGDDCGRHFGAYDRPGRPDYMSSLAKTPVVDSLASKGVLFMNAFCPAPSSTPCRSSLITGQYFWETGLGAILYGAEWDESLPSWPKILKKEGYHTGFTYKVWGPGKEWNQPFGLENEYIKRGNTMCFWSQTVSGSANREAGIQGIRNEVRGNFEDFLAARPDGKPFCYWWGPWNTHREWTKGSGKELWGIDPDDLEGHMPAFLPDVPEVREDVADYLGEVSAFDWGIGVLLDVLKEKGELDNTIIVVSGDHGMAFPRSKCNMYDSGEEVPLIVYWPGVTNTPAVVEDFVSLMDLAPTFLEMGGVIPPASMDGRSIVPLLKAGRSGQIDPSRDAAVFGRERHMDNARDGYLPYPERSIVTSRYKYIRHFCPDRWPAGDRANSFQDVDGSPSKKWYLGHLDDPAWKWYIDLAFAKRPAEELYDRAADPGEVHNLAADPAYASVLEDLRGRLEAVLKANQDPRVCTPEGEVCKFEKAPFTSVIHDRVPEEPVDKGGLIEDFESPGITWTGQQGGVFSIVDNPDKCPADTSSHCGCMKETAGKNAEFARGLTADTYKCLDFTQNGYKLTVLVKSDVNGPVRFRIDGPNADKTRQMVAETSYTGNGQWQTLTFDFSSQNPKDGVYKSFLLIFNVGNSSSTASWYFDNIAQCH